MRHFSIETSSVPDTEYVVINDRLAFRHDISQWLAETRTVIEEHEAEESRLSEDGDGVGASRPTVAGSWGTRHEEAVQVSSEFSPEIPGFFPGDARHTTEDRENSYPRQVPPNASLGATTLHSQPMEATDLSHTTKTVSLPLDPPSRGDWESFKLMIIDLYNIQGMPLWELVQHMEYHHAFKAT